ncbi:MAG: hypothetical protein WD992_02415 [Candidatus Levyibacteriota bacterium]
MGSPEVIRQTEPQVPSPEVSVRQKRRIANFQRALEEGVSQHFELDGLPVVSHEFDHGGVTFNFRRSIYYI